MDSHKLLLLLLQNCKTASCTAIESTRLITMAVDSVEAQPKLSSQICS